METLTSLSERGQLDLIGMTISCANVQRRQRSRPQCGYCSQCIDRRFATAAAHAEEHDPVERYGLDVFQEALPEGDPRVTAISYVRFARQLERLSDDDLLMEYPELIEAPAREHSISELEAYVDLLRRHASGVLAVLSERLAESSSALAHGELPASCLLVLTASDSNAVAEVEFAHSESYSSVRWRGREFELTEAQAGVVRNLHRARESGIEWVSTRDALADVDTGATRVSDVFKGSPAWKSLVITAHRGRYRLDIRAPA